MWALSFALAAAEPDGSPLPEIGRTRSTSAACAAMRDLVVPSFAAAQRADARFAESRKRLPRYGELLAEYDSDRSATKSGGVFLEGELMKLGVDAATLAREAQLIKKLLDDPRLTAAPADPSVLAERAQLQQLYAMQQARANLLTEFVQRETVNLTKKGVGMEDSGGVRTRMRPAGANTDAGPAVPAVTAPPGMPLIGPIEAHNRARLEEWGSGVAKAVHDSENEAARTFLAVAQQCR